MTLSFLLVSSGIIISHSSAQEDAQMPDWIKSVAGWWADGEISQSEFLSGIEYLINNNIIELDFIPCSRSTATSTSDDMVPDWVKNNAKWWAEDLIADSDFINGIEYLIKYQIISIDNRKILGNVPLDNVLLSPAWNFDRSSLVYIQSNVFEIYGKYGHCYEDGPALHWTSFALGIDTSKMEAYNEIAVWDQPTKAAVVYPYFTSVAYHEPGFYTYFRGDCDTSCIFNLPFSQAELLYTSSGIGHQALTLLGYTAINDIDIDRNPGILQQFDKVVMLHNEYVTRTMFDAITSHPNVVYLYPNALYAEIEVDYIEQTMTLIRGHNYPEPEILNGFDWEFDNTHPYEYDSECKEMKFYPITNGWMTNCYPENVFLRGEQAVGLLKTIKDL